MKNVTQQLADLVVETKYDDLPDRVVHEAKRVILDSIGCALAGMAISKGRLAVDLARRLGGRPESSIFGTSDMVSSTNAAFANGELITALDFDALLKPATHVAPFVLPPAISLAESRSASGKDIILAAVLGHEITSRVASGTPRLNKVVKSGSEEGKLVRSPIHGYSANAFGSAASAGKVLNLDGNKMAHCFGIAGYNAPMQASAQRNHSGTDTMIKWASPGWMAQMGITAALLAELGYTGDISVLDGEYGFWRFSGSAEWHPEAVLRNLGVEWHILNTEYKSFPCCGIIPVDMFAKIVDENKLAPEEIEEVKLWLGPPSNMPLWQNRQISNEIQAQFSIAYNIAVAAHGIPNGIEWQTAVNMNSLKIREFMDKVSLALHPDYEKPTPNPTVDYTAKVIVVARNNVYAEEAPKDSFVARRPNDEFLADKFKHNASGVLSDQRIDDVERSIWKLDEIENASLLMKKFTYQRP